MPSSNRPPEITSIVDASLAVRAGLRKPAQMTMCPTRTRRVAIAMPVIAANDSKVISSVGTGTVVKWSNSQRLSNPRASASWASSIVRVQAAAASQPLYSPFQPWGVMRPTCIRSIPSIRRRRGRPSTVAQAVAPDGSGPVRGGRVPIIASMDATTAGFDPTAPLPGPPDPWDSTHQPSATGGPPFHMTDMIAAEPAFAVRLLRRLEDPAGAGAAVTRLLGTIRETSAAGLPIVVTGCGTSEHGAMGVVELLRDGLHWSDFPGVSARPIAAQAFELALDPPSAGLVIGISHEGGTWATNRALETARAAGARVGLVTVTARSPGAVQADPGLVVETAELDQSWCHTIGYLSPLVVGVALAAALDDEPIGPVADALAPALEGGNGAISSIEAVASALGDVGRMLVIGSGADRVAGRELTLKLEEGTWIPSAYRDLETMLHGHWPATGPADGLVLILDRSPRSGCPDRAGTSASPGRGRDRDPQRGDPGGGLRRRARSRADAGRSDRRP